MKNYLAAIVDRKSNVIILILVLSLLVDFAGYLYYKNEKAGVRQEEINDLKAISFLMKDQLLQWRKERSADAFVLSHLPSFIKEVESYLESGLNKKYYNEIKNILTLYKNQYGYKDLLLVSAKGKILLSVEYSRYHLDSSTVSKILDAEADKEIKHSGFYYCNLENETHYDVIAPLVNSKGKIIAEVVLRVDPENYLYPLIQTWPSPSQTSETLLLRKEKDNVLFLNELRHIKNTALKLKIPLTKKDVPAVVAVEGYTGEFEGIDYRGAEVLAYLSSVPGTNWFQNR